MRHQRGDRRGEYVYIGPNPRNTPEFAALHHDAAHPSLHTAVTFRCTHRGINGKQTAVVVLADLEHVLRVPRHPVRVRAAERERQPHLPDAWRGDGRDPHSVDRSAADRSDRAAHRRVLLRSHLDRLWPPPSVLPRRSSAGHACAVRDAELAHAVDRRGHALGARRVDQYLDGTVPRVGRRPVAGEAAPHRLCDAELFHRDWLGDRQRVAVAARTGRRRQHRWPRRSPRHRALCVLLRWRGAAVGHPVDGAAHARIPAGRTARL